MEKYIFYVMRYDTQRYNSMWATVSQMKDSFYSYFCSLLPDVALVKSHLHWYNCAGSVFKEWN